MSEKDEAIRQINEIKNHLVDKQTFFPYNYKATYVWAMIALILTFITIPIYEKNILQGTIITFIFIALGFITEGFLTKKVNQSYDIEDCTHRQRFIMQSFFMVAWFLIVFSAILASYKLYVAVYLSWLFLISLVYFAVGFVLNIKRFTQMSTFNMFAAILLLAIGLMNDALVGTEHTYLRLIQVFIVLGLSIMPAIIAWQQLRDGK